MVANVRRYFPTGSEKGRNHSNNRHLRLQPVAQWCWCGQWTLHSQPPSSGMAPCTQPVGNYQAQKVKVRQRVVLGSILSPDPCLLGDGISPSWLEQESLSTKLGAMGGGGHLVLSGKHPTPHPLTPALHPSRIKSGCWLHEARAHILHEKHQSIASGLRITLNR